jgi:hypothetical protein
VTQWQTWSRAKDVFGEVVQLNEHLLTRSFLVGSSVTLADIQVYWSGTEGVVMMMRMMRMRMRMMMMMTATMWWPGWVGGECANDDDDGDDDDDAGVVAAAAATDDDDDDDDQDSELVLARRVWRRRWR